MNELMLLQSQDDTLYDEIVRENLEHRTLIFNEDVNDNLIENYILHILKWNREDRNIEPSKRRRITLILNSSGGDCIIGFSGMVNCIEQSKTPIRVVGIGLVASMAFYIYITAKERFCLENTVFLMHDGEKSSGSTSGSKFKDVARFFDSMDERTKQHVLKYTKMTEEFYDRHLEREFYCYAETAKELGCVDYIIGKDCDLDEIL